MARKVKKVKQTNKPLNIFTLSNGDELVMDKKNITRREWLSLFNDARQTTDEANAILARFTSSSPETFDNITMQDYQLFLKQAINYIRTPPDPN